MTPTPPPQMTPSYAKASEATPEEEARAIVAPFRIDAAIVYPPDYEPLGGDAKELVAAIAAAIRRRAAPPASAEVRGYAEALNARGETWTADWLLRLDARATDLASRLRLAEEVVELYFSPWGAAKGEMWESMSGDQPFDAEVALKLVQKRLATASVEKGDAR